MLVRNLVLLLLFTPALAATTYINCASQTVLTSLDNCVSQAPGMISCPFYTAAAACIDPACCGNTMMRGRIASYNSSLLAAGTKNCSMPCAGGQAAPADVIDCDSTNVTNLVYNQRTKLGFEGDLTQATGCKYYQNYASAIPKACCDTAYYKSLTAFMPIALAVLKIEGCTVACGMTLSDAPSAPRAVFGMAVLSVVFGSVLAGY
jgi:hypothetical protein